MKGDFFGGKKTQLCKKKMSVFICMVLEDLMDKQMFITLQKMYKNKCQFIFPGVVYTDNLQRTIHRNEIKATKVFTDVV